MKIYRTKYNQFIDENNIEISHEDYLAYLETNESIEETEFVFPDDLQLELMEKCQIITRRQFKIALAILGYNENDILNGISQLPEPTQTVARISYMEAGTFERSNPELEFVAKTFLQLTDSQIDEIFIKGKEF